MNAHIWKSGAGWQLVEWTAAGVARYEFGFGAREEAEARIAGSAAVITAGAGRAPGFVRDVIARLDAYFEGSRVGFDLPLDFGGATDFHKRIWKAATGIAYGKTASYGEVARAAGSPGGARAAGNALNANPLAVIVPCHRVIKSDGALGGFATGADVKRALLDLERGARADFTDIVFLR